MNITREAKQFWKSIDYLWNLLYQQILREDNNVLFVINNYLPKIFRNKIDIEIAYTEINGKYSENHKNLVTIYISPLLNKENIKYMETLYNNRVALPNLLVAKYRIYNPESPEIKNIEYNDGNIFNISDFGFQHTISYSAETKLQLIDLVICVKKSVANKTLTKKEITFVNPENKSTSSRDVWIEDKYHPIDVILLNTIGEYNLIHNVGYIEILPEDDPVLLPNSKFLEMSELKNYIKLVSNEKNIKKCNYCDHTINQLELFSCEKCNKTLYCCRLCQNADSKNHKNICNN